MKRTTFKREPCSILKDKDDVLQQIKDGYLYVIGDSEFQKSMTLDKQDQLIMSVHDALSLMLVFGGFVDVCRQSQQQEVRTQKNRPNFERCGGLV